LAVAAVEHWSYGFTGSCLRSFRTPASHVIAGMTGSFAAATTPFSTIVIVSEMTEGPLAQRCVAAATR
jgi:H+/Cl- antiporter ClcA